MAEKKDTKKKKADKKSGAGPSKDAKKAGEAEPTPYSSVATHPRASVHVRMAKGWGGLAGFAIAGVLSLRAGLPTSQMLERALIFGVVGYVVVWALTVIVWRQLMIAEQRVAVAELKRRHDERAARDREEKAKAAKVTAESS